MPKKGRPTKYKAVYCKEIIEFFDVEPWELREVTLTLRNGTTIQKDDMYATRFPTMERFAHQIGVNPDTIVEWAGAIDKDGNLKHPDFSAAYARAKALQKDILVENGLQGRYNGPFAIFVAQNFTDMRDKKDITSGGEPLKPMVVDSTVAERFVDAPSEPTADSQK